MSEILALVASAVHIIAFGMYHGKILRRTISPNAVSWGLWAGITVLNFTSYQKSSGDWWMSLLPTVSSVMCIVTFFITIVTGQWSRLSVWDLGAGLISIAAVAMWHITGSSEQTNAIVQFAIIVGFIPNWRSVWIAPRSEPAKPWFIWAVAYGIGFAVVLLRWEGRAIDLLYPGLMVVAHAAVGILALRKK